MSLRKNIEYLRKQKNLSQEDLAHKLGVSRQAVSKWESGAAYPETEKIMKLCDMFDCTMDELMKDSIEEANNEKEHKYSINDIIAEVTKLVQRTSEMISSMTFLDFVKFCGELFVLFIIISIMKVPFSHLISLGNNIFYSLGDTVGALFSGVWIFAIELIYTIFAVLIFLLVYKVRFLDKFEKLNLDNNKADQSATKVPDENTQISNKADMNNTKVSSLTHEKVRVYDFGIFSTLSKFAVFSVKAFALFISLPVIFFMISAMVGVVLTIYGFFVGLGYVGMLIMLVAFVVFAVSFLYMIYNFVVGRRQNWKLGFILLISSILVFATGSGLSLIEFSSLTITTSPPVSVKSNSFTKEIEMNDELAFYGYYSEEFITDETLVDTVRIEVEYYDMWGLKPEVKLLEDGTVDIAGVYPKVIEFGDLQRLIVNDLKADRLSNYGALSEVSVKISSSKENVEMIKDNTYGWYDDTQMCDCDEVVPENPVVDETSTSVDPQ